MDAALLATVVGLAALDALNPFSIAALAYLLATPDPLPRSGTFVVATFLTYLAGGLVLVRGLAYLTTGLLPRLPAWVVPTGEAALAAACLVAAVITFRRVKAGKVAFAPPKDLSLGATALFAVASTASDIPTGAPYIAAAGRISATVADGVSQLMGLLLYNLIYVSPLITLFLGHVALGARARPFFARLQRGIDWAFAHLTPALLAALGAGLAYDAYRRFTGYR